jgi:hypothetical protein
MKNSQQFGYDDVHALAFRDGHGTDEVIYFAVDYAVEITGGASKTAVDKVKRFARRMLGADQE